MIVPTGTQATLGTTLILFSYTKLNRGGYDYNMQGGNILTFQCVPVAIAG